MLCIPAGRPCALLVLVFSDSFRKPSARLRTVLQKELPAGKVARSTPRSHAHPPSPYHSDPQAHRFLHYIYGHGPPKPLTISSAGALTSCRRPKPWSPYCLTSNATLIARFPWMCLGLKLPCCKTVRAFLSEPTAHKHPQVLSPNLGSVLFRA